MANPSAVTSPFSSWTVTATSRGTWMRCTPPQLEATPSHSTRSVSRPPSSFQLASGPDPMNTHPST
ncbi:hypothetical protein R1T08_14025 [Streptomyces sp. SBC-4]|nr:hypothetical protein [Streptomyces sp. SBC-4]MDV5145302.1 hypothetical protein [Streptomyces sp. SBC-4]